MKIILSPSKTADYQTEKNLTQTKPLFPKQTNKLIAQLRKYKKSELGSVLNISGTLLDETYGWYKNYHKNPSYQAFPSFNGLVFKQLHKSDYTSLEYDYIQQHLIILDALYGVLEPGTVIKPYRLDMKAKLGFSLYSYWSVDSVLDDEFIINLASKEFAQMISKPVVTIEFYENQNGTLKSLATYSKMARGQLLDYMIRNHSTTRLDIEQFTESGYRYNPSLSTEDTIVFVR